MDDRAELLVEQQMGYSAAEFTRALRRVLADYALDAADRNRWLAVRPGDPGRLEIAIVEQPPRRLGLLELPVLDVSFRFLGFAPGADRALLDRLQRGLHRGGG